MSFYVDEYLEGMREIFKTLIKGDISFFTSEFFCHPTLLNAIFQHPLK